jgi:hypothetical protein
MLSSLRLVQKCENMAIGTRRTDQLDTRYAQKLALTTPTSGRSVGVIDLWTEATEFSLV